MENGSLKPKGTVKRNPEELFNKFIEAEDCPEILQTFQRLVNAIGVVAETPREFYKGLKSKLQSWKCKSLWELLDNRANQKEYLKGNVCEDIHALVIGCGPIGLRTAIELSLLGAQVVIVEKRKTFARNNVLHLWPFLLTDFRSLGAKKFYGKFCSGAIDHISIRRLQAILLKTALILGVKVFTGMTFDKVIEPTNEDVGWKCHVTPFNDALTDYEVDVVIGADGKKNVLPEFAQIEMRGTLAIGITANFVNNFTEEETRVEEISGIAYQFNPGFFDKLKKEKGIHLENIVYYKDETHYFVMTAVKSSLLKRGVLKKDYGNKPVKLLSQDNVDQEKLVCYVNDAINYATNGQLHNQELKRDDKGRADIAVFDFTSIKKAENSARIIERKSHKLLLALVGDSLLEPFWPTGSGCARGVLSALDAAWMVRSFAQDKPPLQILSERENIYRLLSGTSNENMHKNHAAYTINPSSRYTHIPQKKIQEVYHLYDTDDPVNADFSLGSPTGILAAKGSKMRRVSTAIKPHYRPNRKHIKFTAHPSLDSQAFSSSGSSLEDLTLHSNHRKRPTDRQRTLSEALTSGGEEVHEITTKKSKWGKRSKKTAKSPISPSHRISNMPKSSASAEKGKPKKPKMAADRTVSSPASTVAHHEKTHKRRSFFAFGRVRSKSRTGKKSPRHQSPKAVVEEQIKSMVSESRVESSNDDLITREIGSFSRNHPMRRSARDIIAEIEARNNTTSNITQRKHSFVKQISDRSLQEITAKSDNKTSFKRTTSDSSLYNTPPTKHSKTEDLWKEIESMSPCARGAVPALSTMNPDYQKENHSSAANSNLSSAMRIAGLMAIATPLLASDCRQYGMKDLPWYSRNTGRVKDTINKYDSLTSRRFGLTKDGTPLRAPSDRVDNADRKPTLMEVAQRIMLQNRTGKGDEEDSASWHPTALAVVEGKTTPSTISNQASSREKEMEKLRLLGKKLSSLDQESTDSPIKKDFSSPIYRKTFLADLNKADDIADLNNSSATDLNDNADLKNDVGAEPKDEKHGTPKKQLSISRDYAKEGEWRKSPALALRDMERLMLNLTETVAQERTETSIKFLISMFRRIQRNPKEDKFRRIFKSRVKFKKYVWTIRNAKMFLFASGWIEVGSFLLFPFEKNVREPLSILNKYLGLLVSGSTVQISTIKSTPRREINKSTPSKTGNKTESTTDIVNTPRPTPRDKGKPLDRQFSSVPLNLDHADWDLEMEDPLEQVSINHSDKKSRRVLSAFELRAPRTPATPDFAIIEEIEELSNTLDDLMESLEDDDTGQEQSVHTKIPEKRQSPKEIKDLYTTIDYLLNSSEEEELDRDLSIFEKERKNVSTTHTKKSAFTKITTPSNKQRQLPPEPNTLLKPLNNVGVGADRMKNVSVPTNFKAVKPEQNSNDRLKSRQSDNAITDPAKSESKTRRKLPKEPKSDERTSSSSSKQGPHDETTRRKVPIGQRNEKLSRQISEESLKLIQRRFGSESCLSTTRSANRISSEQQKKTALQQNTAQRAKARGSSESSPKENFNNQTQKAPVKRSQSEVNVSCYNEEKKGGRLSMKSKDPKLKSTTKNNSNEQSEKSNVTIQRPATKTSLRRENSNTESVSSVDSSASLKGRPPSGIGRRTRSERAKKRQEISKKLECLETSYDSLENSPKKTSSRKSSTSSSASSRVTENNVTNEQRKSSRGHQEDGKTGSAAYQSRKESQEMNAPAMRTRSRSAKRTPSNASIEHETIGSSVKGEKLRPRNSGTLSQSNSIDKSKPVYSEHDEKTSTKAKRKLPSKKLVNAGAISQSSNKEKSSKKQSEGVVKVVEDNGQDYVKTSNPSLNDSFDDLVVVERMSLESTSNGNNNNNNNDNSEIIVENAVDTDPEEDLKVELKLKNTGSWMVLDYEGTNNTPPSTRNSSFASRTSHDDFVAVNESHVAVDGPFEYTDDTISVDSKQENQSKSQTNGMVQTDSNLEGSNIVRRNALRKKKNRKSELKTQSTVASSNGKKSVSLTEDKHNVVKPSTIEKSAKGAKSKAHAPFGLRRKKIGESCPDINGTLEHVSPVISTSLNSSTSSLDKSVEKKKVSPFKLLAKKRKSPDSRSLKNT